MIRRPSLVIPILVLGAALWLCAAAGAAVVTVGSTLSSTESPAECTGTGGCAIVNGLLSDPEAPVVSPVSGAVVLWRLGDASALPGYQLLTLRQTTAEEFIATGSSPAVTPAGSGGVEAFPAAVPIKAGEYVGIDIPDGGEAGASPDGAYFFRTPGLASGTTGLFQEIAGKELSFNADVQPAPRIASLGTTGGPTAGGTTVTIGGTDFAGVQSVDFGALPATFHVDSESQITATSPAGAAGSVPVTVTTIAGSATAAQQFTYAGGTPAAAVKCKAPKLIGKKLKAAKTALKRAHCKLGHVAKKKGADAKVTKQKPKPGAVRKAGSKVAVQLG